MTNLSSSWTSIAIVHRPQGSIRIFQNAANLFGGSISVASNEMVGYDVFANERTSRLTPEHLDRIYVCNQDGRLIRSPYRAASGGRRAQQNRAL